MKKMSDPIGKLMGLRYKSHPWHGIDIGKKAPDVVTCYIEMVPVDTVKYEVDKVTGYLKIDRPQKYSNFIPALYGFIPQTYSGMKVAELTRDAVNNPDITGDDDPVDICVLTEKEISHGDILVQAKPIGGFRMIDRNQSDDKLIAVLNDDYVYGQYNDVSELPVRVVERLKHYFLTYKDIPGQESRCQITHTFGRKEAHDLINRAIEDYQTRFTDLDSLMSSL